jgi:hypothetical protein
VIFDEKIVPSGVATATPPAKSLPPHRRRYRSMQRWSSTDVSLRLSATAMIAIRLRRTKVPHIPATRSTDLGGVDPSEARE